MVVADARLAQLGRFGAGARARMSRALGHAHHLLQHLGDVASRETEVAMPPLPDAGDQPALRKLGQMRACRLSGNAGLARELARRQRLSADQRRQPVGARRIAGKRGNGRDGGAVFHISIIAEASSPKQALICTNLSMEMEP